MCLLQLRTVLMMLFGYPYNNDLGICKDSPDYLVNVTIPAGLHNELLVRVTRVICMKQLENIIIVQQQRATLEKNGQHTVYTKD